MIRIKGTDLGIRVYVDPDQTLEYNRKFAEAAACKLLAERSIVEIGCCVKGIEIHGEVEAP